MGVKVREKVKGSGAWYVFINHKGRRRAVSVGSREAALKVSEKAEKALSNGKLKLNEPSDNPFPTYKEYAVTWLETQVKPLRKESTHERYKDLQDRYVLPYFGKHRLDEIKRADVRVFLGELLKKGLSYRTVEFVKDVLSGPLGLAVDEDILQANPCTGIMKRIGVRAKNTHEYDVYNRDEISLFLETAATQEKEYCPLLLTLFRTGMRLGETLALSWGDIDWNGRFFMVRHSLRRGKIGTTKTGRSRRVDMTDHLAATLKAYRAEKQRLALASGNPMSEHVFTTREGHPLSQNTARNAFKRVARKAGLRELRVHDARHSYASILISEGAPIAYVQTQLGHSSIQMTVDRYTHWIPSGNHVVNTLDEHRLATQAQPR